MTRQQVAQYSDAFLDKTRVYLSSKLNSTLCLETEISHAGGFPSE